MRPKMARRGTSNDTSSTARTRRRVRLPQGSAKPEVNVFESPLTTSGWARSLTAGGAGRADGADGPDGADGAAAERDMSSPHPIETDVREQDASSDASGAAGTTRLED